MEKRSLPRRLKLAVVALGLLLVVAVALSVSRHRWAAALTDENPAIRAAAVRAMSWVGHNELLIAALDDEDADVRLLAAQRVEKCEPLVRALKDRHAGVRREAAYSLGRLATASCPYLYQALEDNHPRVRAGAARALLSWHDEPKRMHEWTPDEEQVLVPLLCPLVGDSDEEVRRLAVVLLERFHLRTPEIREQALRVLRAAAKDPVLEVREAGARALKRFKPTP
jgi:HEAT repeat protein